MARTGKASLLIIFVTVFIDLLGFGIVLPLLPRYGEHFEASGLTLGLLMASFSAMQFLFAPLWGRLSDRIGRRPVLIVGLAGSTVSYSMFGFATSLGRDGTLLGLSALAWLFVTRIGQGIAGATITTAQAYIADVTGEAERSRGMALIGAAFGIGFTFGPLIGGPFVPADLAAPPSPLPGYVAGALSGLALLAAIFLLPESLPEGSRPRERHWLDVGRLGEALRRPSIGLILITVFLTTFAFAQLESTLALLTERFGLGQRSNYFVFAYVGFTLALSQGLLVRRLLPKLGEWRMAAAGTALMTLGLLLMGAISHGNSIGLLACVLPISVIGYSALTPSLQAILSLRSAETEQGGMLGLGQSMSALARILGPAVGMPLFEHARTWPYYSGAALMLVGLAFVFALRRGANAEGPREPSSQQA